jgi:hypothetical protein
MDYLFAPFDFMKRITNLNTVAFNHEKIKIGKKYAKNCHCVIGSLLRDAENSYSYGVKLIKMFSKIFKSLDVFILENDSKDNTRKLWEKYSKTCPKNVKIILISLEKKDKNLSYKTKNHEHTEIRIRKMVKLRNILLKNIKKKCRKDDETYIFITDLDIKGEIVRKGIYDTFHYFKKKKIDAIGCNGLRWDYIYYDQYAYKNSLNIPLALDVPINDGLFPVISTFSGGIFYKYNTISKLKYKFKKEKDEVICEHVTLNEKIKNIAINTNMIYYIYSH